MPNNTTTRLTVTGPEKEIQKFIGLCCYHVNEKNYQGEEIKDSDGKPVPMLVFDFDKIIPCPKELERTISPTRTEADYNKALKNGTQSKELQELRDAIEASKLCQKKYGYSNWYDFKCYNWGTKWGAYDCHEIERSDGKFVLGYSTAWSPAQPIIIKLGEMFPKLHFINRYMDEGWGYYGSHEVCGEEEIDCDNSNGCHTDDFIEFANQYLDVYLIRCSNCNEICHEDYVDKNNRCERCQEQAEEKEGKEEKVT